MKSQWKNQEEVYQKISKELDDRVLVVPFTGDVNFSESEVVDRLIEIFGDVEIIPGVSSIQVAASKNQGTYRQVQGYYNACKLHRLKRKN